MSLPLHCYTDNFKKMALKGFITRNNKKLYLKTTELKKKDSRMKYEHKCEWCGIDFISNRKTARFCCSNHRIALFRLIKSKS